MARASRRVEGDASAAWLSGSKRHSNFLSKIRGCASNQLSLLEDLCCDSLEEGEIQCPIPIPEKHSKEVGSRQGINYEDPRLDFMEKGGFDGLSIKSCATREAADVVNGIVQEFIGTVIATKCHEGFCHNIMGDIEIEYLFFSKGDVGGKVNFSKGYANASAPPSNCIKRKSPRFGFAPSKRLRTEYEVKKEVESEVTSIYFSYFPESWNFNGLWHVFSRFGYVANVFVPRRRNRSGKKFGFVRFKIGLDLETLETNLINVWIGSIKLVVKQSRPLRSSSTKLAANSSFDLRRNLTRQPRVDLGIPPLADDYKSAPLKLDEPLQNDLLLDLKLNHKRALAHVEVGDLLWLKPCLVGELKFIKSIDQLPSLLDLKNFPGVSLLYLGWLKILFVCDALKTRDLFLFISEWLLQWLSWIKPWKADLSIPNRVVFLDIFGVPVHAWNKKTFISIGSLFGDSAVVSEDALSKASLLSGRIQGLGTYFQCN